MCVTNRTFVGKIEVKSFIGGEFFRFVSMREWSSPRNNSTRENSFPFLSLSKRISQRELIIGRRYTWRTSLEKSHIQRAPSTVGPHLWVIIAHSCMPRDKYEAIRKAGSEAPSALPAAFICLDPREPVNRGATWRIAAVRRFQCFVPRGCSPFIGISAHSIMGIIKEMGWVPTRLPRRVRGGWGRLLWPSVIKETQDLAISLSLYSFPFSLETYSEYFETRDTSKFRSRFWFH